MLLLFPLKLSSLCSFSLELEPGRALGLPSCLDQPGMVKEGGCHFSAPTPGQVTLGKKQMQKEETCPLSLPLLSLAHQVAVAPGWIGSGTPYVSKSTGDSSRSRGCIHTDAPCLPPHFPQIHSFCGPLFNLSISFLKYGAQTQTQYSK